ncbi:MAG: mandelate racemase [Chloroflexota bacterium]|nr:mandelate racemase [Chloroflexota bacterium]
MKVKQLTVSAYRIPTDQPEEDGTHHWEGTTLVLAEVEAESGERGLGFTYAAREAGPLIQRRLANVVNGSNLDQIGMVWERMIAEVRNLGRPGIAATAISAVDVALWDLRARVAGKALFRHLGAYREQVPIYGSGGFTTYSEERLREQLGGWVAQGIPRVKMKIGKAWGTLPREDLRRIRIARDAIGPDAELFVDANGAYSAKQAIRMGRRFADLGVTYFEEPVSSDQLQQLALVRQHIPPSVAAGEYGYDPWYFRAMLQAGAVDILQADVTRCLGITGWLQAAALAYGFDIPFSGHTAPSIHAHVGCAAPQLEHVEYFYDHARIEQMLFDAVPQPQGGFLRPDPSRAGLGLDFKHQDAEQWRINL